MICKKCSATIPEDGLFCPVCGARADGNKICPKCEKLIPEESVFCAYCGTKVGEAVVPKTEPKVEEQPKEETEEEPPVVQGIVCSQCGSGDVELISENLGKCNNCGTQVIINTPKETNVVTNNVNIQMVQNSNEPPIEFYELPKEIDINSFCANALTKIALDKDSPDDIFTATKFEPVKTYYRQYVLALGDVETSYSATVGYDRKEQYTTTTNKYLSQGSAYTYKGITKYADKNGTYTVDTIKERTVTDWQPFSGTNKGEYVGEAVNGAVTTDFDLIDYAGKCSKKAIPYDSETSKTTPPLPPSAEAIKNVKRSLEFSAELECKRNLPGDRNKDFHANSTTNLTKIQSHVAPQHVLKYNYMGKDYVLCAHSVKESEINGDIPSAKTQNENEIDNNKIVKTFNIITFSTLLFSILASILFPIALKIIFCSIGIVSFITFWIVRSKISKSIYYEKKMKKKKDLIALLTKNGIKVPEQLKARV